MVGERLDEAVLTPHGILGDRAYALLETESGKVVSAKNVKAFPNIFGCSAAFVTPPQPGRDLPAVRITFPDGGSTTSEAADVDAKLTGFFGRGVALART